MTENTFSKTEIFEMLDADSPVPFLPIKRKYETGVASAFILSGMITDYASPTMKLRWGDFLRQRYALMQKQIVVSFNVLDGLTFFAPSMEKAFRKASGFDDKPAEPKKKNALSESIAASLGQTADDEERKLPTAAPAALSLISKALLNADFRGEIAVIIEHPEAIAPAPGAMAAALGPADRVAYVALTQWATDFRYAASDNIVFMLAHDVTSVHESVTKHWSTVEIGLPSAIEREIFIETFVNDENNSYGFGDGLTVAGLVALTAGLSYIQIENTFLSSPTENKTTVIHADTVRIEKEAEFAKDEGMTLIHTRSDYTHIGGLKTAIANIDREIVQPMLRGETWGVPMGVLFAGPPGTGKSIMAEAMAGEAGIPMIRLDMSKIASKWQGEGERNLRRFLTKILRYAPVIVFIDEIDQVVSSRDGGAVNQQESRMLSMLLEFMSDTSHRGRVVFIAATNRPDLIDAAMKRPGRFDVTVVFPVPARDERADLFAVFGRKYNCPMPKTIPADVLDATDDWTGAELEPVVMKARKLIERENMKPAAALRAAVARIIPNTGDKQRMTELALADINDLDWVPEHMRDARERIANRGNLETEAAAMEYKTQSRGRRTE